MYGVEYSTERFQSSDKFVRKKKLPWPLVTHSSEESFLCMQNIFTRNCSKLRKNLLEMRRSVTWCNHKYTGHQSTFKIRTCMASKIIDKIYTWRLTAISRLAHRLVTSSGLLQGLAPVCGHRPRCPVILALSTVQWADWTPPGAGTGTDLTDFGASRSLIYGHSVP